MVNKGEESITPEYFVYMLGIIVKIKEAGIVAQRLAIAILASAICYFVDSLYRNKVYYLSVYVS